MNARTQRGFTLFELLITMAIVGMVLGLVVGGMGRFLETDMKSASARLAAVIRYLYAKSVTESAYIRLVLDFDQQVYWVEATGDPVRLSRPSDSADMSVAEKKASEEREAERKKQEEQTATAKAQAGEGEVLEVPENSILPKEPQFGSVDSYLLKPTKLPDGIFLKDVYVEHRDDGVDSGKEYIYFFPNGYVESAVINLRNEDDDINYSLKTYPLSGRVGIENAYRSLDQE